MREGPPFMLPDTTIDAARALLARCEAAGLTLATAESCTGGLLGAALTAIPGSSKVFGFGWATYSDAAKQQQLGVAAALLAAHGAVSLPVAAAMAEGARRAAGADLALSCTGVAGPGGGSAEKPVGLVFIGVARTGAEPRVERHVFPGDRQAVRAATVAAALALAETTLA